MEHQYYLGAIKRFLKARKINYVDLAKALRMTESGVKKMLNAKDISFRRVLQIADLLSVSPGQLLSSAETLSIPIVHLTKKQQESLLQDKELLIVFWRMVVEKKQAEEIAKLQDWQIGKVVRLLEKLARLQLVIKSKQRFLSALPAIFRLAEESELTKKLNRDWSLLTLERALTQKSDKSGFHRLLTFKVGQHSHTAFIERMSELLDDIVRLSERDSLQYSQSELSPLSAVVAIVKSGMLDV